MSEVKMKMMDGNEAAASVAHRMNEVCGPDRGISSGKFLFFRRI